MTTELIREGRAFRSEIFCSVIFLIRTANRDFVSNTIRSSLVPLSLVASTFSIFVSFVTKIFFIQPYATTSYAK